MNKRSQSVSAAGAVLDPAALFTAHRNRVRRALVRLVGEAEADDLTQEVFLRVTRALPEFRGESSVSTWILRIARGVGLDHLRSRRHREARRTVSLTPSEEGGVSAPGVATTVPEPHEEAQAPRQLARTEMSTCVREYVNSLAPEHRAVIELKDLEGLSNPQIAARLGVSVDNVKIRLHRARQALRRELERGCDFYQSDTGALACDRRKIPSVRGKSVSFAQSISSKEVRPPARARSAKATGRNQITDTSMNTSSTCGCADPSNTDVASAAAFSPIAAEYVAIGAAIGSNCEPCLRYHVAEARKVGISLGDIAKAVSMAAKVKETPAANILKLAARLTQPGAESSGNPCSAPAPAASVCGCS